MKLGIPKSTERKLTRMVLRWLPLIPGPELYDIFIDLKQGKKSINEKIEKAYTSLKDTSELISDLENDLIERTDKVKELKEKYEDYSKLADIEEEKIQPLLKQLEKTVGKGRTSERIISFVINLVAGILIFILGIWAAPKVNKLMKQENKSQMEQIDNPDSKKLEKPNEIQNKKDSM